ncbi:MAG: permease, partial [Mariniblastus sp.]|nr:permease [Mariniblastus sp.]
MLEYYFAGAGLRLSQVIIYSSLWIVTGCLIAAIFRCMLGAEKTRRIFADGTRWGLAAGWLIGMLLPVCSLGVIPIVRELHRAGVNRGTIVAFGLTAPLFNPMSVLYGLTLSDPIAILSFSLCALVIVSVIGYLWDRWLPVSQEARPVNETLPVPGIKRMLAVFYTASRELAGPTLIYILIGICGSVLMAVLL